MKIKSWKLELVWEDGTINDVSNYVPEYTARAIEDFADYWEDKNNDDNKEEQDDEDHNDD